MNHPATFVLPLAAGRVLDVLHSVLVVGEVGIISHAEIAEVGHIGESTVSAAMSVLCEHGFLTRTWDDEINGGRGGYLLTLLPLPSIEDATHPPVIGSADDPSSASEWDHSVIGAAPNMVHDHDLSQEEEFARAREPIEGGQGPLYDRLMCEPNMNRGLARELANSPLGTLADFEEDLAHAPRPGIRNPFFYVVAEWRANRRVQPYIEEHPHGRQDAPYRAQRSAAYQRRPPRDRYAHIGPDPDRDAEYAALMAEFERASTERPRML